MQKVPAAAQDSNQRPSFTMAEVRRHNKRGDCWVVVRGKVHDVTELVGSHPGGSAAILGCAGKDGTSTFLTNHDDASPAHSKILSYVIGDVREE
jgi:cytochrome b involved in lipid metabolism